MRAASCGRVVPEAGNGCGGVLSGLGECHGENDNEVSCLSPAVAFQGTRGRRRPLRLGNTSQGRSLAPETKGRRDRGAREAPGRNAGLEAPERLRGRTTSNNRNHAPSSVGRPQDSGAGSLFFLHSFTIFSCTSSTVGTYAPLRFEASTTLCHRHISRQQAEAHLDCASYSSPLSIFHCPRLLSLDLHQQTHPSLDYLVRYVGPPARSSCSIVTSGHCRY